MWAGVPHEGAERVHKQGKWVSLVAQDGCEPMSPVHSPIWLRVSGSERPDPPPFTSRGPAHLVDPVVGALRQILEPDGGADIVASGRVVALEIGPDEACLTLSLGMGQCHGAHAVAEAAFDVLRACLPDLDLYLAHATHSGCTGQVFQNAAATLAGESGAPGHCG